MAHFNLLMIIESDLNLKILLMQRIIAIIDKLDEYYYSKVFLFP